MKKSEIFDAILNEVSAICEVRQESIIAGLKLQSVVDARVLAVQYMRRAGLSNDDIALIILRKNAKSDEEIDLQSVKRKAKIVDRIFKSYTDRCLQSYAFCLMSAEIKKICREKYQEVYLTGMKSLPD